MLLKFDEFNKSLNEGFLSKTLGRSKSGEERLEDKITSNIDELNEIDLGSYIPFTFADVDLVINGEEEFTREEYLSFKDYINSKGWRLPTAKDIKTVKWKEFGYHTDIVSGGYVYNGTSHETKETLSFFVGESETRRDRMLEWGKREVAYHLEMCVSVWEIGMLIKNFGRNGVMRNMLKFPIRLIKDKK